MEADKTICGGACMYELGAVASRRRGTALATHIQRFDDTVVSSGLVAVAVAEAVAMGNLTCSMTAK